MILLRGGYPPAAVPPGDRLRYIRASQDVEAGGGAGNFDRLLYERLDATLGEYIAALKRRTAPERCHPGSPPRGAPE